MYLARHSRHRADGVSHRRSVTRVRLFRSECRVWERAVPVVHVVSMVRVVRPRAVRAVLVTTSMWQRGGWDAPVNNLMVRSQSACSFRALEFPIPAGGR